jgi:hypothetical protein
MSDISKPLTEIARNTRNTSAYLHPVKLISPEYDTISVGDSPYTIPTNTRSITFVLWGVDAVNTVSIAFPNTTKLFDDDRYYGFAFFYAIDIPRDCELISDVVVTITGTAIVDFIYTTD